MSFELRITSGTPGFLSCPKCREILCEINVRPWKDWIINEVAAQRKNKDRSYWRNDPEKCSENGIGAELAACLSLCPGHLQDWMNRSKNLDRPNPGQDLLGEWIGCGKDFEIKSTPHYSDSDRGIMYIRKPSDMRDLIPSRDVHDSIYALFTGEEGIYCGRCWADRSLFLAKGVMNPPKLPTDGFPTFGNHHSKFLTFSTIVKELRLKPAGVTLVSSSPA
jgi:hypothetical protein